MIKIKLTWGLQSIRIEDYIREQEENTWVAWHFVRIENFLTGLSSETRKWHLGDRRRIHDWKYVALYKKFELDFSWLGSTIQERMIVIYDFRQPFLDPTDAQEYLNLRKKPLFWCQRPGRFVTCVISSRVGTCWLDSSGCRVDNWKLERK
jgi:hypothetical protein